MKQFSFRLEKVLEYRQMTEAEAKDAFLAAKMATLQAEGELRLIREERVATLERPFRTLAERQDIELMLEHLDDRERHTIVLLGVLRNEEEMAIDLWNEKRKEVRVLEKLREKALETWQHLVNVEEQNALDEWSVTRRVA